MRACQLERRSQKPVSNLAVGRPWSCGREWIDGDQVSLIKRFSRRKPRPTGVRPANRRLADGPTFIGRYEWGWVCLLESYLDTVHWWGMGSLL